MKTRNGHHSTDEITWSILDKIYCERENTDFGTERKPVYFVLLKQCLKKQFLFVSVHKSTQCYTTYVSHRLYVRELLPLVDI